MRNRPAVDPTQPAFDDSRQSQSRSGGTSGPALDRSGLAQAQVFLPRRSQPGHCRTVGAGEPAAVPKARGQPRQPVRATGPAGAQTVAGHALPDWRMADGPRQHRLSHRSGAALLQRAVRAGASRDGRAPDGGHRGSPPPRGEGGFACALLGGGESHYADRAHAQSTPEVSGAHAVAVDRRGPADRADYGSTGRSNPGSQAPSRDGISRSEEHTIAQSTPEVSGAHAVAVDRRGPADRADYGSTGRSNPGSQAPSRDGISVLSGDSAIGENLSRRAYGSGRSALSAGARLQLPEHGLD